MNLALKGFHLRLKWQKLSKVSYLLLFLFLLTIPKEYRGIPLGWDTPGHYAMALAYHPLYTYTTSQFFGLLFPLFYQPFPFLLFFFFRLLFPPLLAFFIVQYLPAFLFLALFRKMFGSPKGDVLAFSWLFTKSWSIFLNNGLWLTYNGLIAQFWALFFLLLTYYLARVGKTQYLPLSLAFLLLSKLQEFVIGVLVVLLLLRKKALKPIFQSLLISVFWLVPLLISASYANVWSIPSRLPEHPEYLAPILALFLAFPSPNPVLVIAFLTYLLGFFLPVTAHFIRLDAAIILGLHIAVGEARVKKPIYLLLIPFILLGAKSFVNDAYAALQGAQGINYLPTEGRTLVVSPAEDYPHYTWAQYAVKGYSLLNGLYAESTYMASVYYAIARAFGHPFRWFPQWLPVVPSCAKEAARFVGVETIVLLESNRSIYLGPQETLIIPSRVFIVHSLPQFFEKSRQLWFSCNFKDTVLLLEDNTVTLPKRVWWCGNGICAEGDGWVIIKSGFSPLL